VNRASETFTRALREAYPCQGALEGRALISGYAKCRESVDSMDVSILAIKNYLIRNDERIPPKPCWSMAAGMPASIRT